MAPVYRANSPTLGQFADAVYWKGQAWVLANPGMIERFAPMRLHQFAGVGVARNLPEAGITAANGMIKRRLPGQHKPGARHECQPAFRQRFLRWRPGTRINSPPRVRLQEESDRRGKLVEVAHTRQAVAQKIRSSPERPEQNHRHRLPSAMSRLSRGDALFGFVGAQPSPRNRPPAGCAV